MLFQSKVSWIYTNATNQMHYYTATKLALNYHGKLVAEVLMNNHENSWQIMDK